MRSVHWLFLVSVALFVSGIGFLVVSTRAAKTAAPAPVAATTPVASVKQIMQGIVDPAATIVFNSVGSSVTIAGTEEHSPKTAAEWDVVGNSAAALVESGNLLVMGSRAVDSGDWITMARALMDAGQVAMKAVEAKNADALFASGEAIYIACDNCHKKYQRQ